MIVPWLIGVLLNAAGALVLYFFLLDVARPPAAVVATIVAFVVSTVDCSETPLTYNHSSLIFALFGAFAGSRLLRATSTWGNLLLGLLAGAMIGLSFQVKQTVGGMIFLVLPSAVAVISLRLKSVRTALLRVAAIGIGFALPCVPVVLWLWRHNLWHAFLDNAFLAGTKAKGDLWHIFLRPFIGHGQDFTFYLPPLIAVTFVALTLRPLRAPLQRLRTAVSAPGWKRLVVLGAAALLVVLWVWALRPLSAFSFWDFVFGAIIAGLILCALFPERFKALREQAAGDFSWRSPVMLGSFLFLLILVFWYQWPLGFTFRTLNLSLAALSTFGCLLLIASSLPGVLRRDADLPAALLFYAYCVSFACGYALAISWPFFEYMAFPALGVVLAAVSARRPDLLRPPYRRWAVAFVAVILFTAVYQKVNTPFFWAGWCEPPPWSANAKSKLPQLEGFVLSKDTANFIDDVTGLIREHSTPDERILVYPHMPMFYALSERRPATRSVQHWLDVCPDNVALADAERIREKPPAVIVAMEIPDEQMKSDERMFRGGRPGGQRAVWDAIQEVKQKYKEVGKFEAPGSGFKIKVWSLER